MRGGSILEVVAVFMSSYVVGWLLLEDVVQAEVALLGWSYISGALLILVPVAILLLTGRNFSTYGLTMKGWRHGLGVGMKCYLVRLVPLGALVLMYRLGYGYTDPVASAVIAAGEGVAILLFLRWIGRKPIDEKTSPRVDLAVMVGLLLLPVVTGYVLNRLSLKVVSTVAWQFLFSGFGEEIRFRGYARALETVTV